MANMKDKYAIMLTAAILTITGVVAILWWFSQTPQLNLARRVAGAALEATATLAPDVDIKGTFTKHEGIPSTVEGAWPRFRGADSDNISKETVLLANSWPEQGPPLLWEKELGEGYAGAAVIDGRVYLLDYDEEQKADSLLCISLDDGREIWKRSYKVRIKRNHGMSRTVPAVTTNYVVTMGPKCHVMCVRADTGEFLWGIDLVKEFGAEVPLWYTGQCPIIDNGEAILAPGGESLMIGVDCETGEIKWRTPNPGGLKMSHSSIMPVIIEGRKVYLYCAIGGIACVSADEISRGTLLWESNEWNHSVIAPSPVYLGDGRIFVTAGYGGGSALFRVKDNSIALEYKKDKKEFASEQHSPVFYRNHIFTVMPNDAGATKRQAACMTPEGKVKWRSGKEERFGLGPYMIADNKLFILDDSGLLTMAKADTESYTRLAQAKVLKGPDAWGPFALVNGRLILRDFNRLICLDMRNQ